MGIEIERRFLVCDLGAAFAAGTASSRIAQGYFGIIDKLRVRVRILSNRCGASTAFLTFKGARRGLCRLEFEYPLAVERAQRALGTLPSAHIIRKIRYEVCHGDSMMWSVDQFLGANSGLVLAEVELAHPSQKIKLPKWVGEEVTFDPRYGNSRLARTPMPSLADVA